MEKELDEKLCADFPKIFVNRHGDMKTTAMCWGFDCLNGWYWLIRNLCKTIQGYINANPHLEIHQVVATQVKEKYGKLRFYYSGGDNTIEGMVWFAQHLSGEICEKCGKPGKGYDDGWIVTRCPECYEIWQQRYDECPYCHTKGMHKLSCPTHKGGETIAPEASKEE